MVRTQDKSPDAFRTISEVAAELDVPQHVLRFWESKFASIKPLKRGGGRRYYRPDDLDLLRGIRTLLYRDEMTIRAVQHVLREQGVRYVTELGRGGNAMFAPAPREQPVVVRRDSGAHALSPAHGFAGRDEEDGPALTEAQRRRLSEVLEGLLELKQRLSAARRVAEVSR
jgi:DNA-binding transcriptional MerR regulator